MLQLVDCYKRAWKHFGFYKLTAEGLIAPVDEDALLSAVAGVGGEDVAVTRPLRSAAANLRETEAEIGFPLHHVMTGLRKIAEKEMQGKT